MTEPASTTVCRKLRKMIITGELAPGTILSEAELAEQLGCSRTPLREALWELRQHNLIDIPSRRGILISPLGILDFQQAVEAALILGHACVKLAAERIDDQQLERLREIVVDQERANKESDFYATAELDCRFHVSIAQATGNRHLTSAVDRLHTSLLLFTYPAYEEAGNAAMSIGEHRRIVGALERREDEVAQRMLRQHLVPAGRRVLDVLGMRGMSEQA